MADQIRKIIELVELPNVSVQVIPFERGGYPMYGPFLLFEFSKARDIVHLEHKQASGFLNQAEDTAPFHSLADTLRVTALRLAGIREFLADVAAEYEKEPSRHRTTAPHPHSSRVAAPCRSGPA